MAQKSHRTPPAPSAATPSGSSSAASASSARRARKVWTPLDATIELDAAYAAFGASWRRSLQAENMAPQTLAIYLEAHKRLGLYLAHAGMSQDVRAIRRAHIEGWLVQMFADGYAPASVSVFYRGIHRWFTWLEEEEEIAASPTRKMRPPIVPETYKPVLTEQQIDALLATCSGREFADYRDLAMLSLLFDTGMRRSELAGMTLERLNLDEQFLVVPAKGRRDRVIAFGKQTVRVIDKYLRKRALHPHAGQPWVFVGQRGRFTGDGVRQMLEKRAVQAGLGDLHIHPHLFRHTYAHLFLEAGGQESDLMAQAGWNSPAMARHYGKALREQRAREAAKRLSPADRRAAGQTGTQMGNQTS